MVGVTVQGIEAEVFAGVFEVVLLPPPVAHPVGDLGSAQGAVGQDRGLVPVGAAADDQPQRQRAGHGRLRGGGRVPARDSQGDGAFGE